MSYKSKTITCFRKNRFPPERKLLSEEEYYEEGAIETTKALDDLRSFCSSPECNAWKTITKLKNPTRYIIKIKDIEIKIYTLENNIFLLDLLLL